MFTTHQHGCEAKVREVKYSKPARILIAVFIIWHGSNRPRRSQEGVQERKGLQNRAGATTRNALFVNKNEEDA